MLIAGKDNVRQNMQDVADVVFGSFYVNMFKCCDEIPAWSMETMQPARDGRKY